MPPNGKMREVAGVDPRAWRRNCHAMDIPDPLRRRLELFAENSWIRVMLAQGIEPHHHPVADLMGDEELSRFLDGVRDSVERTVAQLPAHQACVEQHCKAPVIGAMQG
jgi:tryptophan halogenase